MMYVLECWQMKACRKLKVLTCFVEKNKTRQQPHWFWSTAQLWEQFFFSSSNFQTGSGLKGNIYTIINLPKSSPTKAGYELKLRFSPPFQDTVITGQNNKAVGLTLENWRYSFPEMNKLHTGSRSQIFSHYGKVVLTCHTIISYPISLFV